jgi:hypothetical protein
VDQTWKIAENLNKKKFQTPADKKVEQQRQELKRPSLVKPVEPLFKDPFNDLSVMS